MEYNKWFLITMILGLVMVSWITSCQPSQHNDVQMRTFNTDTVNISDTTVKEIK